MFAAADNVLPIVFAASLEAGAASRATLDTAAAAAHRSPMPPLRMPFSVNGVAKPNPIGLGCAP